MRSSIGRFALGAMVLALIGFASGAEVAHWMDSDAGDVTGSLGSGDLGATSSRGERQLPLSEEERAQVFDGVMRINNAPVADVAALEPAQVLPQSVELQDLPPGVARLIPLVEGYKFVKLDDRILLVNPKDRRVVAWMPRYKLVLN
jgi:hypothetical protein